MVINYFLKINFYPKYQVFFENMLFDDSKSLIFYSIDKINSWIIENTENKEQLAPDVFYGMLVNFGFRLPYVLNNQSRLLIENISSQFNLVENDKKKLQALVFNFGIKSFIENEFGHKFIRFSFEGMENRLKEIKEFENTQKESLAKLSKGTLAPIHELEPVILNFINSQFQNYHEFKNLKQIEEIINRKKEFFPEIFSTGKPKTIAFNEFIYGLYLLISEKNSNYMPFIKYVVDELNQIDPKYFERNNISVEALRKKTKDQIKLNSK